MDWIELKDLDSLNDISKLSYNSPIAIFKHSTSCGISRMVYKNFKHELEDIETKNFSLYYLDLLAYRNISNAIADKWKVEHQSPQLLIIKDDLVIHHSSHYRISSDSLLGS